MPCPPLWDAAIVPSGRIPVTVQVSRLRTGSPMDVVRELPPLRHCGDVGTIESQDTFEDVACFGNVPGGGDDADVILVGASGSGDVEAASCRLC